MKNYTLLFFLLMGWSVGVYGQYAPINRDVIPSLDTVIMRGEEIEVGAYLKKRNIEEVKIVGFGKSKKSDFEKLEKYTIKQTPKQTITYKIVYKKINDFTTNARNITVYVAKNEEEKKQFEAQLKAERKKYEADRKTGRINMGAILGPPPAKK